MTVTADLHTHTLRSYTGSSSLYENLQQANKNKLSTIAITDYGPKEHSSKRQLFEYLAKLPHSAYNINILRGVEANITDLYAAKLDIDENDISNFDWIIGSYHQISEYDTNIINSMLLTVLFEKLANNPLINTIGHMERYECGFDVPKIISIMKQKGKVVEIGSAPFNSDNDTFQKRQLISIIDTCKELSAPICIVSNAHYCDEVGKFDKLLTYLDSVSFPENLIINSNLKLLRSYINNFKQMRDVALQKQKINYGATLRTYQPNLKR